MSVKHGTLIISLDFELLWGKVDSPNDNRYRANLLGARDAVAGLLDLFSGYGIHATWAVVGFLFFDGRDELLANIPDDKPTYLNSQLSPYRTIEVVGRSEKEDPLHFAPSLIQRIARTPNQEIGTHTLSHYYCLEPGQQAAQFREDITVALRVAQEKFGLTLRSIVFPRNQINDNYLPICSRLGLTSYRGNLPNWIHKPRLAPGDPLFRRGVRLLDSYVPLTGSSAYPGRRPDSLPCSLTGSRFLRPWSASRSSLEGLRFLRIDRELKKAAVKGHVYHLWWHPHNFGRDRTQNLGFLKRILDRFARYRETLGLESLTMEECVDRFAGEG